jgi:Phage integrase family
MDRERLSKSARSDRTREPRRRPRQVRIKERDGYWHATGTLIAGGRTARIRRSLGLAVATTTYREAEEALAAWLDDERARLCGGIGRGDPVAVTAAAYVAAARARPLGASAVRIIKAITARFTTQRLNAIAADDWRAFVDERQAGNIAATRERFLNGVVAFLNFATRYHGLAAVPEFRRDRKARNPNRRARRRTAELRPELIRALFDAAHISLRAQLVVEWSTGARVSSVLYDVRLCDLNLGKGREQITFRSTKNGEDVTAALNPTAVKILKEYLKWRGMLQDREAPLFLTFRRRPYTHNGKSYGGQNKTAFRAARRRACAAIIAAGECEAARLRAAGKPRAASAALEQATADAALLGRVTQHWFRHLLATRLIRSDPRATMEQGGWLDIRSVMGYVQDVAEHRRRLVIDLDDLAAGQARRYRSS